MDHRVERVTEIAPRLCFAGSGRFAPRSAAICSTPFGVLAAAETPGTTEPTPRPNRENFEMLYISCRVDLRNEDELGESDTYWDVTTTGGRIRADPISEEDLRREVQGEKILVVVHGYNNEFEDIPRAFDMIEARRRRYLSDYYDRIIGYTWPGGDDPTDYIKAKRRSGVVAPRLAANLRRLGDAADTIDVMSHSMGARIVLSAYPRIPRGTVRCNFLLASAIDNESIEAEEKYHAAMKRVGESLILHSKHDGVLRFAYSLAEWDSALGLCGPENPGDVVANLPNTTVANCKRVVESHGGYKSSDPVFRFIREWMSGAVGEQFVTVPNRS